MPIGSSPNMMWRLRVISIAYLAFETISLVVYWAVLATTPGARAPFLVPGAPDSTVMAFMPADLLLYASTGAAGIAGLVARRRWVSAVLWVHAGAAAYGALYALALGVAESRWLGAGMMAPALVAPPLIAWWSSRNGSSPAAHPGA